MTPLALFAAASLLFAAPKAAPKKPAADKPAAAATKEDGIFLHPGLGLVVVVAQKDLAPLSASGRFTAGPTGIRVLTKGNLWDVGSRRLLMSPGQPRIDDFAELPGGLVAISESSLGFVEGGKFKSAIGLPQPTMRLARASNDAVYVYGGAGTEGSVFRFKAGGTYQRLVSTPAPVSAVAASGDYLFIAAGPEIYVRAEGAEPARVLTLPKGAVIESLVHDPERKLLYFSALGGLWVLRGRDATLLAGISGQLQMHKGLPIVYDKKLGVVLAVAGVPEALAAAEKAP